MAKALATGTRPDIIPQAASVGTEISGVSVDLGEVDGPAAQMPNLKPNAAFYIAIHPNRWHVRGGVLIPQIRMLPCVIGIQGAMQNGKKVNMDTPKSLAAADGYTVVPTKHGPGGESYLKAIEVRGGTHFCTVWEIARAGEDTTEFNRKDFHDWAWAEVKAGRLPAPSVAGLRRERAAVSDQHMRAMSKSKQSSEAEALAAETARNLAAIDEHLAKRKSEAPIVQAAKSTTLD